MFFVGRLILRELHFIYKNKLYMFLIVKAFATALEFNELNLVIKKKKPNMIDIVSIEILFFG
jgi:hypothetical protein